MEEQWQVDRGRLRRLQQEQPERSVSQLAAETGRSTTWVKKWRKRFKQAPAEDAAVLKSQSRRPKRGGSPIKPEVEKRILAIRDEPLLNRVVGPLAIKYFLHKQEEQEPLGCYLPTSSSTIWRILDKHHRIYRPPKGEPEPFPQEEPLKVWQIDFKDVTTVKAEPGGKKQHVVETLNVVDTGTSILLSNPAHPQFNAETVLHSMALILQQLGCPQQITFDRDPRFVASASGGDFPAPFVRFLACLGIKADICPPQRPDRNGFVERYNRTYKYEGILIYLPETLAQVTDMNLDLKHHYNFERPNQAKSCGNQPPRLSFPSLPLLPPLPTTVDPDAWLDTINGEMFKRRVNAAGTVQIDKQKYYVGRAFRGRLVLLRVDALNKKFVVELNDEVIKTIPIKGLFHGDLSFPDYLDFICKQAVSNWRLYIRKHPHYLPLAL